MLEYMRKNVGSWLIKFMLFGIAIIFAFWGVGSYTNRDVNTILTIDDVKVPYNEYRDLYNSIYESYRSVYENLDASILDFLDIKTQAIDALVERYLLFEAARRINLEVSASEVAGQIASIAAFQENGVFSRQKYQYFLDSNRLTPDAYEASVSRDLTLAKVMEIIKATAVITPQEIEDNLELLTRKAVVRVVRLGPNDFIRSVPRPGEQDLLDFFDENKELYRVPEMFRQAVVVIDPDRLQDQVQVTPEEIQNWYEDHEEQYTKPAAYHLKHILFSLPKDASAQTISAVRLEAEEVVRKIQDKEITFEKAVREYSDDGDTVARGGDMGFVEEKDLDRPVLQAAQDLDPGQVSDPIPTAEGFEVIRLTEFRKEQLVPLEQVQKDIQGQIRREKAFELAYDKADDLLDKVQDSARPLEELAREQGLTTITTPLFSRTSPLETMELPVDLLKAAFDTEEEEVGDIYERDGKLYLFQTVERNDSYLPEMDQVRDQVEGGLLVKRAMEMAREKATDMLAAYQGGRSLKSLAASMGKTVLKTEPFTIMETSLNGIEDAQQIVQTAFSLSKPGEAAVAGGKQGQYLLVLDSFVEPDDAERTENRSMIEGALMYEREQDVLKGYIQALREEMGDRIVINQDLL